MLPELVPDILSGMGCLPLHHCSLQMMKLSRDLDVDLPDSGEAGVWHSSFVNALSKSEDDGVGFGVGVGYLVLLWTEKLRAEV